MNITPSTIYWITRLDGICLGICSIGMIILILGLVFLMHGLNVERVRPVLSGIFFICLGISVWIANIFVPTTKEMAAIYIIPSVVNNENVQKFAENSLDGLVNLSNKWVKEKLTDVKE